MLGKKLPRKSPCANKHRNQGQNKESRPSAVSLLITGTRGSGLDSNVSIGRDVECLQRAEEL